VLARKFVPFDKVREWRNRYVGKGPVVAVNGCFDVLHVGHVRLLEYAASYGSVIVAINSDESVTARKGRGRPINIATHRAEVLMGLEFVQGVTVFDSTNASEFLRWAVPEFWVKGGDYSIQTVDREELAAVENAHGQVLFFPLTPGASTTRTIAALTCTIPETKPAADDTGRRAGSGYEGADC
jgi:rfaE bifunctional protein nucleotidyltransferase chain/domain